MEPSPRSLEFASRLTDKLNSLNPGEWEYLITVQAGKRFDRLVIQSRLVTCDPDREWGQRMCCGFVDRTNDCLLKSGGWVGPAKIKGYYMPKYDLSNEAGMDEAVFNADPYGSYLYDSYKIKERA